MYFFQSFPRAKWNRRSLPRELSPTQQQRHCPMKKVKKINKNVNAGKGYIDNIIIKS